MKFTTREDLVWGAIEGYYEAHPTIEPSHCPEDLVQVVLRWDPTFATWSEDDVLRSCRTWLDQI